MQLFCRVTTMRKSANEYNIWSRGLTKETDPRLAKIAERNRGHIPWNKGLTKKTDERIAKVSEHLKTASWSKGLTKETCPLLAKIGEKLKGHIPWNKGLTKKDDDRLLKISKERTGDNNPMSWKNHPDRGDEFRRQSETMKRKIANGEFTPQCANRLTHKMLKYDNITFRSSWEVIFYYLNQDKKLEYESLRIPYTLNGVKHTYIADFYDPASNTIYEVKPDRIMYKQKSEKNEAIKKTCIEKGYKFVHIGDEWQAGVKIEELRNFEDKNILKLFEKSYRRCKLRKLEE